MKSDPGTYILILQSKKLAKVQIGRWGIMDIESGYYIYIGSALGPGGVKARVSRHFRRNKKNHWHIDYLAEQLDLQEAWLSYGGNRLEHIWAKYLLNSRAFTPIPKFGSSDCNCYSHLFYSDKKPSVDQFSKLASLKLETWAQQQSNKQSELE